MNNLMYSKFNGDSLNKKLNPYDLIRSKIHEKIRKAKQARQEKINRQENKVVPAKSSKKKRDFDESLPKAKAYRKCTESLIVKSSIQKEFSFPVSSRSSNDTYVVTMKIIDGELKLECNCGSKFGMSKPRSNCVHCISSLLNLVGNTISSVKNKDKYMALNKFYTELNNVMDKS